MTATTESPQYARVRSLISSDCCVLLDGATGSELIEVAGDRPEEEEHLWGMSAITDSPQRVKDLHRHYVEIGCDVISTDTWAIPTVLRADNRHVWDPAGSIHWMDVARTSIRLARDAAQDAGRADEVAIAFSMNADIDAPDARDTIQLLLRVFEQERPDLILVETMSLIRSTTYATVEALIASGLPVWLSFRRCRHGVCGVYGEHWGGPEGDAFGRAARRFEELGIEALAINCIPPDHVVGMFSWLRDFTDLPLGVYPNLGYLSSAGWRNDRRIRGAEYAQMALNWRAEGAQIVGGCCGVGPEHLAAAASALQGTRAGHSRPTPRIESSELKQDVQKWSDARNRELFPLDFPELAVDAGVAVPTQASFMLWKYLYREDIGSRQRCVDIGSGSGLLAIQLARNGATHVHAIDIEEASVQSTLQNAFRNGVADRITTARADVFPWVPQERYDVIVALLWQNPSDPFAPVTSHRPRDFWGRNLVDHLIGLLPKALADDGVAYMVQFSVVGQERTLSLLQHAGYSGRVVDFTFVDLDDGESQERDQILRVEQRSDAYHLTVGARDVMIAYLIEITKRSADTESW